jgi:hypothetical protein
MKKICLLLFIAALSIKALKAQTGLNFDGVDDRITIPNNAAYNVGTGNFTIEAWVKLNTTQTVTFPSIISKRDAGNINSGFLLMVYQGTLFLQIAGFNILHGTINIQDNVCHHVAFTRTDTVVNFYVDGVFDGTTLSNGNINTTHAIWIGHDDPAPFTTHFKGLIHEMRYWNIGRTQTEIQGSKNTFLSGSESGLIGYWRMNDATGQTVNDFTALNNDGFLGTINTADNSDPVYMTGCLCGANITAGGPITFCNTGSVLLIANSGAGLTYQWQKNGNNISGATSQTYTATTAGNYTCVVSNGCGAITSNTITITFYTTVPASNITAGGPTTFCSNSNVLLSSTNTGTDISYQWQKNSIDIAGAVSLNYTANQTGSYRCVLTNQCGSSNSNAISVTVNTQPTATITPSGTVIICTGSSQLFTASAGTGYVYQWKKNGADISGATSQTYTTPLAGSYSVVVTLGTCTATSAATTLNDQLTATITPSGTVNICTGASQLLTASAGTGYVYQWKMNGVNISGATLQTYTTSLAGSYTVVVTLGTCTATSAATILIITASCQETTSFNGPGYVCYPQTITLFVVNPVAGHYYQWYRSSGSCMNSQSQQLSMGLNYIADYSGMYYFTILDQNFMPIGQSALYNVVRVMPAPASFLTAPESSDGTSLICHQYPATLCIPNGGLTSPESGFGFPQPTTIIKWYKDGQQISTAFNYTVTSNGYYRYSINDGTCENYSDSVLVSLKPVPSQITAAGPTSFCYGDSVVLNASIQAGVTYEWHHWISGFDFSTGVTTPSYTAKTSSTYFVVVTSNASCTASSSGITVSVSLSLPTATITPAGSTTFCSSGNVVLNANTGNYLSYQWKKNNTDISGVTNQNYTTNAAGSYTVVVTNTCGTATSTAVTVTVNALPSATITPAGPTTFCSGGSVVLNAPVAANRTYQWKKGTNLISGATLSSYTATTGGNYRVIVTNTVTGCSKTTGSATVVTVNALPTATITPQGPTTFCAGGSVVLAANTGAGLTYKWKKGSNYIAGATLSNYTATIGGTYKVELTNSNGCSKLSGGVVVSVPCKLDGSESESAFDAKVFPNPNSGEFTIKFSNKPSSPIQIELTDELGKVERRFETSDETVVIKESNLVKGIYCLTVRNKNAIIIKKINIVK